MSDYVKSDASNYYFDNSEASYWCCQRCLQGFRDDSFRSNGKYGCVFPILTDEEGRACFKSRRRQLPNSDIEVQTLQCGRCMLMNSECLAPPEELAIDFAKIKEKIDYLNNDVSTRTDPEDMSLNPAFLPLNADEKEAAKIAIFRETRNIKRQLADCAQPTWEKSELHNGKLLATDNPRSGIPPPENSKSKDKAAIKTGISDIFKSKKIQEGVAGLENGGGSPAKRAKTTGRTTVTAIDLQISDKRARIEAIQNTYVALGTTSAQKTVLTKEKRKLEKEITALEKQK
ncbi:hypothetical protein DDE82_009063 [Stemphylium lycopersici]|uniref:Uncharacterized protein n=1 Tax=Stemphylium lycopersici TaxID=183478 RepID=A0A364MSC3_STELY|nr:hypothetical protein TW65_02180 [Stemphylium lycopersici]RAQ98632.1 hypothetical protein DDE82_009063 [Stemphylium lycopersici]RAR00529.1 hypothetical protein DDE83_009095 [Stemphylium lycopersici]